MSIKRLLVADPKDLQIYLDHGITHYLFGMDGYTTCGYGKINIDTFYSMVQTIVNHGGDVLVLANRLIHEHELDDFQSYLAMVETMEGIKGIVVGDHCALWMNHKYHWSQPLIYAPDTLMASTMDIEAALSLGYQSVQIANEIRYEDVRSILDQYGQNCMIQTFGYLKSSMSARHLLSDYMDEINHDVVLTNRNDLYLVESTRDRHMPIVQSYYGTTIYTDYIRYNLMMEEKMDKAKEHWISTLFLDPTIVLNAMNQTLDPLDPMFDCIYWRHGSTIVKEEPWKR